jgi:hypothetical protein
VPWVMLPMMKRRFATPELAAATRGFRHRRRGARGGATRCRASRSCCRGPRARR